MPLFFIESKKNFHILMIFSFLNQLFWIIWKKRIICKVTIDDWLREELIPDVHRHHLRHLLGLEAVDPGVDVHAAHQGTRLIPVLDRLPLVVVMVAGRESSNSTLSNDPPKTETMKTIIEN